MADKNFQFPQNWRENYEYFSALKREVYSQVTAGIRLEHDNKPQEAITAYEKVLVTIDKVLQIYLDHIDHPLWEDYTKSVSQIKETRKEVLGRLAVLENAVTSDSRASARPANAPPSYDEATSLNSNASPYTVLNSALNDLKMETGSASCDIIFVQDNVRMYFILPSGEVGALSEPKQLVIAQLQDDQPNPKFYLQVGDWIYPLLPGISPILHSQSGAFIIPDVHSPVEGSAVGLVLPTDADTSVFDILEDILQGIVKQSARIPPPRPPPPYQEPSEPVSMSRRISQGLVTGAQYVSYGLVKGAEKASEYISSETPKVMAKLQPESQPQPVPPAVQKSMKVAKNVTGTAAQFTGFLASKIGSATMALGRYLAPHVQAQGTRLVSQVSGISQEEASNKVSGALEVTAGAVEGFGTIYSALENSAVVLAKSIADNTVQIVEHKGEHTDGSRVMEK